jgi:queuine tRNA-ribosyltransferase
VDEEGVTFRSHLDGTPVRFTPEGVVEMQQRLGVDIAMMLDECPPWPLSEEKAAQAWRRTLGWAERARRAWKPGQGGLFGIAQGSVYRRLREQAVAQLVELDFDGYAIGGVSVGEPLAERRAQVEWTAPALPAERPRYLMGLGQPQDILHAVRHGVDLFDCVLPSRNGRHGVLYTRQGLLRIKNARFREDPLPPDPECVCPVCSRLSRALLHHLVRAREITGGVLATLHNLRFYLDFMAELREAIAAGTLTELATKVAARYADDDPSEGGSSVLPDPRN